MQLEANIFSEVEILLDDLIPNSSASIQITFPCVISCCQKVKAIVDCFREI